MKLTPSRQGRILHPLKPGQRVRVRQTIVGRDKEWPTEIEGEVVEHVTQPTGSWYAHGPKGKLMLERLILKKDDGELSSLALCELSQVTVLDAPTKDAST
jgi:hypothetical protein